jgi:hypothetical protein
VREGYTIENQVGQENGAKLISRFLSIFAAWLSLYALHSVQ